MIFICFQIEHKRSTGGIAKIYDEERTAAQGDWTNIT